MNQKNIKPDNTNALKSFDHLFNEIDAYVKAGGDTSRLGEAISEKYGHRLFYSEVSNALELACSLSTPEHELRRLDLSNSLIRANDNTLSELFSLCSWIRDTLICLRSTMKEDPEKKEELADHLSYYHDWLISEVEEEMYNRIQGYRNDINHLKKRMEAANAGS